MENEVYHDPNAFIKREAEKPKQKVDMMHIEKVMYPVNYDNYTTPHDHTSFETKKEDKESSNNNQNFGFDISKLLPLLMGKGNLNSMLPSLLSNLGMSQDILPLLSNFNNFNKAKKVTAKVVNTTEDTISKYKRVE